MLLPKYAKSKRGDAKVTSLGGSNSTNPKPTPTFAHVNVSFTPSKTLHTPYTCSHRPHVVLEILPLDLPAQVAHVHLRAGGASDTSPELSAVSPVFPHENRTAHELGLAELADGVLRLHARVYSSNKKNTRKIGLIRN